VSHEATLGARSTRGLSHSERLVLLNLADHCHRGTNTAWPGVEAVAKEEGLAIRTVRRSLRQLEKRGLITKQRPGGGYGVTTIYALAITGYPATVAGLFDEYPANDDTNTRPHRPTTRPNTTEKGASVAPEPVIEPVKNLERRTARAARAVDVVVPEVLPAVARDGAVSESPADVAFRAFWATYPRRVARTRAAAAFKAALSRDGPDVVATGLATWCTFWHGDGTEERFIPHPTTWLSQSRYLDQPPAGRRSEPRGFAASREYLARRGQS
jgi:hypothetical protein